MIERKEDAQRQRQRRRTRKYATVIDRCDDIVRRMCQIDSVTLNNMAHVHARSIEALVDTDQLADFATLYCVKTGAPYGTRQPRTLADMLRIHGAETAASLLRCTALGEYSPLWSETGPDTLSNLRKLDPVGYFVYSWTRLEFGNLARAQSVTWELREERRRLWQGIVEALEVGACRIQDIMLCNELLRRHLGLCNPDLNSRFAPALPTAGALIAGRLADNPFLALADVLVSRIRSMVTQTAKRRYAAYRDELCDRAQITLAVIGQTHVELGGLSLFHKQARNDAGSADEAAWLDLAELDFGDGDESSYSMYLDKGLFAEKPPKGNGKAAAAPTSIPQFSGRIFEGANAAVKPAITQSHPPTRKLSESLKLQPAAGFKLRIGRTENKS